MEVSNKRLITGFVLVFLLGVMFAIVNGYYVTSSGDSLPLIVYAISFVSIIIGASIVIMFQSRLNTYQMEKVLRILPLEERKIVKILLKNNNKIEQNYLVVLSGMNKVKISRVIQKLVERDVIEKKNLGNTNLIILKD